MTEAITLPVNEQLTENLIVMRRCLANMFQSANEMNLFEVSASYMEKSESDKDYLRNIVAFSKPNLLLLEYILIHSIRPISEPVVFDEAEDSVSAYNVPESEQVDSVFYYDIGYSYSDLVFLLYRAAYGMQMIADSGDYDEDDATFVSEMKSVAKTLTTHFHYLVQGTLDVQTRFSLLKVAETVDRYYSEIESN